MKKLFQNQAVAWTVLILAVALACVWGISRKSYYESRKATELLDVKYYQWVNDSAKMLSDETENTVAEYNTDWNGKYYSVVAVATLPRLNGWTEENYAKALGEKWGLGAGDMLLLLVKNGNWYVACGDTVADTMTDTQQTKLKQAIDEPYYKGNFDQAVVAFFRQADVYYAQANIGSSSLVPGGNTPGGSGADVGWNDYQQPAKPGRVSIFKVILLIIAIFAVWAIFDRFRYNRYRRRTAVHAVSVPTVSYYPIFWGRPARSAAPRPPRPPAQPTAPGGGYYRPGNVVKPSSGHYTSRRDTTPTRPSTPAKPSGGASKPSGGSSRPHGFGGGKR